MITEHVGLYLDLDLLRTSRLSQDQQQLGEKFLNFFYLVEISLADYIDALEKNLAANDQLKNKYTIADSLVGGLAGLSAPSVILATAAVAVPIAGAIWVGVGLSIQQFDVEPQIEEGRRRLAEANALAQHLPDVEKAFDAVAFADSDEEADRRFKKWQVLIEDLKKKTSRFFAQPVE